LNETEFGMMRSCVIVILALICDSLTKVEGNLSQLPVAWSIFRLDTGRMQVQTVSLYRAVGLNVLTIGTLIRRVLCFIARIAKVISLMYFLIQV